MTDAERREAARQFYNKWIGRGKEDEDDRSYWIDFLQDVMGVEHVTDRIEFQKKVLSDKGSLSNRIDAYIPETHVLIEQKSLGVDLSKPQPGHNNKTPYEQAKDYDNALPVSEKAKWIIVSNFAEIWIYDMDMRIPEPTKFSIGDIPIKYSQFDFLVNKKETKINQEMEVSVKAGEFVGLIYDALLKQYINPESIESLKSLNMLCVRLVFCLYAEDAHIFGDNGHMFHDYMKQFETKDMRRALIDLFKILDTPENERDPYDDSELAKFPYVNGGLFADENIEIPKFTDEIRDILLREASEGFDWSMISPTIFGAVFESTLNPETRRSGGMHYTSIENIHKVIDPLFLDDLTKEFNEIDSIQVVRTKKQKLQIFQSKLASYKWLDPACGSGNFLTETYISIRRLENKVIRALLNCEKGTIDGQLVMGEAINPIKVEISQFYGIEINDFAVTVAKTALWIAESQMLKETEDIILMQLDFLPLKTNAFIREGNALRINWSDVVDKQELTFIIGNPPFIGQAMRTKEQAADIQDVFYPLKIGGKLDYVSGWFKKAADFMKNTRIRTAFVSSNSICQGESINLLWKLFHDEGIVINFAHRTFLWTSEATEKAAVMCVIVGFSYTDNTRKIIFEGDSRKEVSHINAFLSDAPDVFIKNRSKSINKGLAKVVQGSPPADDGRLLLSKEEREKFVKKYPELEKVIKPFVGSREFINDTEYTRYCFWFDGEDITQFQHIPELMDRLDYIRSYRLSSPVDRIQKTADTPYLFTQNRQPDSNYLIIPRVSSSVRRYIPIGFLDKDVIASDSAVLVYNASLYEFGLICSNVHNAWMRVVAGRLKNDYRYAPSVYYNFPMPPLNEENKRKIELTAQGIINARKEYPNKSLADMYGNQMYLYKKLKDAHIANDKAVMQAYGFSIKDTSEADCVAGLMRMYQEIIGDNLE